jgi:hypothetical protein
MKRFPVIIVAALVTLSGGCTSHAGEARISFTGDIIMHIPVKNCAITHDARATGKRGSLNNHGFDFLFDRIRDTLEESDIVVGNMEFPVSPPFNSKPFVFNCTPDVLPALKKAGFAIMHMANNHVLDQGEQGIRNTLAYVARAGLDNLGVARDEKSARAGVVKEIGGMRVGFLGYTGYLNYRLPAQMNGYHLNWLYDAEDLKQDIIAMKKRCDYLVMVVHAGVEYNTLPRQKEVDIYRQCINDGVDLVIGHHPHLLQPAEKYTAPDGREGYIFYSLGNFISNQSTKAEAYFEGAPITTRDSVVVRCTLTRTGGRPAARLEVIPVHTINVSEAGTGLRAIQTLSIPEEICGLKKRLAAAAEKEKVDIERQLQSLYQKIKAIQKAVIRNGDIKGIKVRDGSSACK